MTDLDQLLRADADRWNATRRPDLDLGEQLVAALDRPRRRRRYLPPALSAAAIAAAAITLAATGVFQHGGPPSGRSDATHGAAVPATGPATPPAVAASPPAIASMEPPPALSSFTGVVWKDPDSSATVVYSSGTIRQYDGCSNTLSILRVDGNTISAGRQIGPASQCTGVAVPPGPAGQQERQARQRLLTVAMIVAGPATWSRHGNTLTLRTPGKGTLRLITDGTPAPAAVGTTWRLAGYVGADGYSHPYTGTATLRISQGGNFEAGDGCRLLRGIARVTTDTIAFTQQNRTTCSHPAGAASTVADSVLSGTVRFEVRGNALYLNGAHGSQLDYVIAGS